MSENLILLFSSFLILTPIVLYLMNRKYFYYSLIILYPIIGQLIGSEVTVVGVNLNPSKLFGLLVLAMTAIDFVFRPSRYPILEICVVGFIVYSFLTVLFSPVRMITFSWNLKIATWLLLLLSSAKVFDSDKDLAAIHTATCIAVLVVIFSFTLSWLGFFGDSLTYETGVESHGAGFHSGKTLAYYLTLSIPILAIRLGSEDRVASLISTILILISTGVIFLTFVRAPVIALMIGFLAYRFYGIRYAGERLGSAAVIILVIAVLIVGASLYFGDTQFMSRWGELGSKYSEGKIDKLGSGRVGFIMSFVDHYFYRATLPQQILGTGLGSSTAYLGHNLIIHNDFAEILMGCGIIGFALYVFIQIRLYTILVMTLKKSHRIGKARYGTLAIGSFFIFLAFHLTNLTSGVLMLSLWGIYTGSTIAYGAAAAREVESSKRSEMRTTQQDRFTAGKPAPSR